MAEHERRYLGKSYKVIYKTFAVVVRIISYKIFRHIKTAYYYPDNEQRVPFLLQALLLV